MKINKLKSNMTENSLSNNEDDCDEEYHDGSHESHEENDGKVIMIAMKVKVSVHITGTKDVGEKTLPAP